MTLVPASSDRALRAHDLVRDLQAGLVRSLEGISGDGDRFEVVSWLRDGGLHGGGMRYEDRASRFFNRASANVSSVHYDDLPERRLSSATALSAIVHPDAPRAPSIHMHVSWTEMRDGFGYWRIMADLNPCLPRRSDSETFAAALRSVSGERYEAAAAQGDRYFFIPALGRHRGVSHFYLESFHSGDWDADAALARAVIESAIETYSELVARAVSEQPVPTEAERAAQLAYHTVYLFQVLTLDRGTTSGLLVHDQNDVGILGSLPARVDRGLLASWRERVPSPQDLLLDALVAALPDQSPSPVEEATKRALALAVRAHYKAHPEALDLQASGDVVPPTVQNHR